ncbi:MAG: xylulokinase [Anaerolineales bacterium]|nr:xylulokinase [Anaerolineales bacterium]
MPHLLGIDLGTSSVKAVLVTEEGHVDGIGSAEYPILQPQPGIAEQNPQEWWLAVIAAVRQAVSAAEENVQVQAIGLDGQMHGTVFLDQTAQPLTPAVIWPDQRTGQQVQEITEMVGAQHLIEITGSPIATGFQAATVRWFQQERPDIWGITRWVLLPKDYLRWRLTGQFASDPSDACSTLLLDARTRTWSAELLSALEIDPDKLPPVQTSISVAGKLQPGAAAELGLPAGIPVITGAGDTASSVLGAGVTQPDTLLLNISTGGQLVQPVFDLQLDRAGRIHTFCSALEPGTEQAGWYKLGGILSAGLALRWLRDNVFALQGGQVYERMTALAEGAPLGSNGLIFLPHLVGERTPYMNPNARGMFLGLTLSHSQPEIVRAVMEGVGLAFYHAYGALAGSGVPPRRIVMAGGGARSPLWRKIMADIFDLPVQRLQVVEQSAIGAALLAGAGIGRFDAAAQAQEWAAYDPPVEPLDENHIRYLEMADRFQDAYNAHQDDFR